MSPNARAVGADRLPVSAGAGEQAPGERRTDERPSGERHDAPVTADDLTELDRLTDRRFEAVRRRQTWVRKLERFHGSDQKANCWPPSMSYVAPVSAVLLMM